MPTEANEVVIGFDESVEVILFAAERAVPESKIAELVASAVPDAEGVVAEAIERLNAVYDDANRTFRIERVAGGYRVMTRSAYAGVVAAMHADRVSSKLSKPAIEALAIIAYRQPMTRAQLEAIRGVGCGEVLKTLLERRLIAVTGRAEELGRPMLYGTTKRFLEQFGLASIKDLPSIESDLVRNVVANPDVSEPDGAPAPHEAEA